MDPEEKTNAANDETAKLFQGSPLDCQLHKRGDSVVVAARRPGTQLRQLVIHAPPHFMRPMSTQSDAPRLPSPRFCLSRGGGSGPLHPSVPCMHAGPA